MMTRDEQRSMESDLAGAVYAACVNLFEDMECKHELSWSGHHMAQEVAKFAENLLKSRWNNKLEP